MANKRFPAREAIENKKRSIVAVRFWYLISARVVVYALTWKAVKWSWNGHGMQ